MFNILDKFISATRLMEDTETLHFLGSSLIHGFLLLPFSSVYKTYSCKDIQRLPNVNLALAVSRLFRALILLIF